MFKVQDLKELIRALDQSSVDELNYEQNGTKITLKKNETVITTVQNAFEPAPKTEVIQAAPVKNEPSIQAETREEPAQQEKQEALPENTHTIISPMVGTFYAAPSPDSDPYVKNGDKVEESTVVCIVEAMKLMNEIEAEANGKIIEILAENGELVEYGQPLFTIELN